MTNEEHGIPSLRISTASGCNHRCIFCQIGGDYASDFAPLVDDNLDYYLTTAEKFFHLGVRHFSLTGGEPLIKPEITFEVAAQIHKWLDALPSQERRNSYLRINTNGVLAAKHLASIVEFFDLAKISLHSLKEEKYQIITGTHDAHKDLESVLSVLHELNHTPLKVRIQSVVTRQNIDEIPDLIGFCQRQACISELKLLDLSEYSELCRIESTGAEYWKTNYVSLNHIESDLKTAYRSLGTVYSVGGYGNPMSIYKTSSGLKIRLRKTEGGAAYGEACPNCSAYSICGDGHCNLEIGPNRLIKICRPKEGIVFRQGEEQLAIDYFKKTTRRMNKARLTHLHP